MRKSRVVWAGVAAALATAVGLTATLAGASSTETTAADQAVLGSEVGIPTPSVERPQGVTAGASQRAAAAPVSQRLKRTYSVRTRKPVFFITIDDGFDKNYRALRLVRKFKIPVTVFLTQNAIDSDPGYFRSMAAYGGTVENHTVTHPVLPQVTNSRLRAEVCGPQRPYARLFGHRPTMLRPPYGEGGYSATNSWARIRIDKAASACGMRHMVMWNALAENGRFEFLRGSLHRGDIVLFHFTNSLDDELIDIMKMAKRKGLRPAPLQDYLR